MLGPISIASEELRSLITAAIEKAIEKGELAAPADGLPKFLIEQPADPTHGDFATNAAMAGARKKGHRSEKRSGGSCLFAPCSHELAGKFSPALFAQARR